LTYYVIPIRKSSEWILLTIIEEHQEGRIFPRECWLEKGKIFLVLCRVVDEYAMTD
jgi:hypothetical protein